MAKVRWTPQAADDLEAICLFIARDVPRLAAIFADRVVRSTDQLASHPRSGRVVPELGIENIREIIVGSYRVIYLSYIGWSSELPVNCHSVGTASEASARP